MMCHGRHSLLGTERGFEPWQSVFGAPALDSPALLPACVWLTSEGLPTQAGGTAEIRKTGWYTGAGHMQINTATHKYRYME